MPLADLPDYPDELTIIPKSGIQFLDFGFNLDKSVPVPRDWGFVDHKGTVASMLDDALPNMVRCGDGEVRADETYVVDHKKIVEMFERRWVPLPLFREEAGGHYFRGPTNWARGYLTRVEPTSGQNFEYRLVVALDTEVMAFDENEAYLAPSPNDAQAGRVFSLPSHKESMGWFIKERWVKDWLLETARDMVDAAIRKKSPSRLHHKTPSDADVFERLDGAHEYQARYLAFIDLIHSLGIVPQIKLADVFTKGQQRPIDVDLVLDLGNSRTCGLLIETMPGQAGPDLSQAVKLELRDLSCPELTYDDPFDSRFEFASASFGRDHLSHLSGRPDAFAWPTLVRIGPEAARLAASRKGSEGNTGMSSPKRYLWDDAIRRQSWRFNNVQNEGGTNVFATGKKFATLVNDRGEALHRLKWDDPKHLPALRAHYSRSHLVSFVLAEIIFQALVMMNAAAPRLKKRNASEPRRLRRIIMTMPTAMPLEERYRLKQRAEDAVDLVFLCLERVQVHVNEDKSQTINWPPEQPKPEVNLSWDEASSTQAVYLYSQIALNYSGDARSFFAAVVMPKGEPTAANDFKLATIDIGGGTTDLVVTQISAEGQGANVTLKPTPLFRESFSLAGDDILKGVVKELVVQPIRDQIAMATNKDLADAAIQELFGADSGEMTVRDQLRRQQFTSQIATPIGLKMLEVAEADDLAAPVPVEQFRFDEFFSADRTPNPDLIAHINQKLRERGAQEFDLQRLSFSVDPREVARIVRAVILEMLQAMAEVVWRLGCDVLLISGRPSRLPVVRQILVESACLPPHRIQAMHRFRVGPWYPFRDVEARIFDPKTTAAVGAMICLLAQGQLRNFAFQAEEIVARSTARYFGKLDRSGRLLPDDVYFHDLDLANPDFELPEVALEYRGPLTLGYRQFPVGWWPATRLYQLDYTSIEAANGLHKKTPLKVELARLRTEKERQLLPDSLLIAKIYDCNDSAVSPANLQLRLQTLDDLQGYWLDTGNLVEG